MGYKMATDVQLRTATKRDLEAINAVIEAAVMGWRLPDRIKRLALPSYRYTEVDYEHIEFVVAEIAHRGIVGVAGCEMADPGDVPGKQALLLHGLYVQPEMQNKGIGTKLLQAVETLVSKYGCDGLLVKAQTDAVGFFEHQEMQRLETTKPQSDYTYRFWKPVHTM